MWRYRGGTFLKVNPCLLPFLKNSITPKCFKAGRLLIFAVNNSKILGTGKERERFRAQAVCTIFVHRLLFPSTPVKDRIIGIVAFVSLSFIYDGGDRGPVSKFLVNLRKVSNRTHPAFLPVHPGFSYSSTTTTTPLLIP